MAALLAGLLLAPGVADARAGPIDQCRDASGQVYFTDQGCRPLQPAERPKPTPESEVQVPARLVPPSMQAAQPAATGTVAVETIEPAQPAADEDASADAVTTVAAEEAPAPMMRQRKAGSGNWTLIFIGLLVATAGHLWMMVSALAAGSWGWGLLIFFFAPLSSLFYFLTNLRESRIALSFAMLVGGSALMVALYVPATDLMDVRESYLTAKAQTVLEERHPRETFSPSETVYMKTVLSWDDWSVKHMPFLVTWIWYTGEEEVGRHETQLQFGEAPQILEGYVPASQLGSGKHRVEMWVDDQVFDSREFRIL